MNRLRSFGRWVASVNDRIAVSMTLAMSTMWCVYVFTIWSVLPAAIPHYTTFIMYVSSAIIQLVALPLIMVGQSVLSRESDARAREDHKTLLAEFELLRELHAETRLLLVDAGITPPPEG